MPEQRRFVTQSPENSETPLDQVRGWVTPNPLFFVRNHFEVPKINDANWRLRIEGSVEHAMQWSLDELMALPERTVFATVECAGNGRSFLAQMIWRHANRVGLAFRTMVTDPQSDDLDARLRRSQIKQRQLKRRIKELLGEG